MANRNFRIISLLTSFNLEQSHSPLAMLTQDHTTAGNANTHIEMPKLTF